MILDDDMDPEKRERIERKLKVVRMQAQQDLHALLGDRRFRAYIWQVLSRCGLYDQVAIDDPMHLAAATAKANLGKELLAECLTADPEVYTLMRNEAVELDNYLRSEEDED